MSRRWMADTEDMTVQQSPSVGRRILASELRRLRAASGMTQQQAEAEAALGRSALSRYESCTSSISVPAAEKLLGIYGVEGDRLAALLDLARSARRRGLVTTGQRGVVPSWFSELVALEREASAVQALALRAVPGYLQTERYARAVLQAGIIGTDVEQLVQARMARAEVLDRDDPPEYWVILCESVLQCQVGGPDVMREQLQHLIEVAQRPSVTVQVLPNRHGAHPSMATPFILLSFDLAPDFGVVYMDYLTGSLYRDEPAEVDQYHRAYRHLIKAALPEDQSLALIAATAKDL